MDDSNVFSNALLYMVKQGDHDGLAELLELEGLDPDYIKNNCIALIHAIIARDIEIIKLLLSYRTFDISGTADMFYTPLHYAVETNDSVIVQLLIEAGASMITNTEFNVKTPLHKSMKNMQFDMVDLMLSMYDIDKIDPNSKQEFVHFNIACVRNNEKLVEEFIKKGINVNGVLDDYANEWCGLTPLHLSVKYLAVEVVEVLLKNKADFNFQDKWQSSPLHIAYYIWKSKNNTIDQTEKVCGIIDMLLSAHTRNINNPVNMKGVSHFHIACMGRNATLVYYFLQSGMQVNSPIFMDPNVSTARIPLHLAIEHNRIDIVKILLQHEADTAAKNSNNKTSLEIAYEKKFYGIAELLLEYNATISTENYMDYDSIFQVFADYPESGQLIDRMFSTCQENIVNTVNEDGLSLLHIACTRKNIDIIDKLLLSTSDMNAYVHEKSSKWAGYTALHFAAFTQNLDAVYLLLQYQADVNVVEEQGLTPLWLSLKAQPKYTKIENTINDKWSNQEQESIDEEEIIDSVSNELKHVEVVKLLAQNKSNLNYKNNNGEPFLMAAYSSLVSNFINKRRNSEVVISEICNNYFQNSARKIMSIFIEHGIDLNVCDDQENHILHYIVQSTKNIQCIGLAMQVAEIILKNGANVNASNHDGNTALHLAVQAESPILTEFFLRFDVDINATNKSLYTPLHFAVELCSRDYYALTWRKEFWALEIDVTAKKRPVQTIKSTNNAISRNSLKILECLLKSNCDVDAPLKHGAPPLFCASVNNDMDCVQMLLEYGADINVKDTNDTSVLETMSAECELMNFQDETCLGTLETLVWHMLKLMMIGQYVDPRNFLRCERFENKFKFYYRKVFICEEEEYDSTIPKEYTARLQEELEKLNDVEIDNYTSLRDILQKSVQQMTKHVRNGILQDYIYSESLCTKFPHYGYLLKLKFRDGLARNLILEKATESFRCLTEKKLPSFCIDNIFTYITNKDMNNLVLAKP